MAFKDYYGILGIPPNETPTGIRAAYRNAVQRTHPDHAGPQAAPAFQDVVEAHSVLSDPDRRRQHDKELNLYQRERTRSEPVRTGSRSVFRDMEALRDDLLRNFTERGVPRARPPQGISVEVILTPKEAARGGVLSIDIPVRESCEVCGGTGSDWLFPCLHCGGEGIVARMRAVQVPIPQSISLGMTREVTLETRGIKLLITVSTE